MKPSNFLKFDVGTTRIPQLIFVRAKDVVGVVQDGRNSKIYVCNDSVPFIVDASPTYVIELVDAKLAELSEVNA